MAASARVGNYIGARSASGAKHAGHAAALLSVVVGGVVMCTMLATKDVCQVLLDQTLGSDKRLGVWVPLQ